MIDLDVARELRRAGLRWRPEPGDRFTIEAPELAGQVFTLSEMTVEAHHYPTGTILGFNGTTEWALDSVSIEDTLWLPREDQLRVLLGGTFRSLTAVPDGYAVVAALGGAEETFRAAGAADAYAQALLTLIGSTG